MKPPLTIKKVAVPIAELQKLSPDQRHSILILGLMLNEANWLRKLLIKAAQGMPGEAEGAASLSLTLLVSTTLAGKIYEGTEKLRQGKVGKVLAPLELPPPVRDARKELHRILNGGVLNSIRQIAFHYPDTLDLPNASPPDDAEAVIYLSSIGGDGDFLSHLSSLAIVDPLVQLRPSADWKVAFETVFNEVIAAAGYYSNFIAGAVSILLTSLLPNLLHVTDLAHTNAPNLLENPLYFFATPPGDMLALD
jgi:hypothetical protein